MENILPEKEGNPPPGADGMERMRYMPCQFRAKDEVQFIIFEEEKTSTYKGKKEMKPRIKETLLRIKLLPPGSLKIEEVFPGKSSCSFLLKKVNHLCDKSLFSLFSSRYIHCDCYTGFDYEQGSQQFW